jgi:head-tail adaptor
MSPLKTTAGSGLKGFGQTVFPEQAKQAARNIGLTDDVQVLRNERKDDGGGSFTNKWEPHGDPVAGRIDPTGSGPLGSIGEEIHESTTHIVTVEPTADVTPADRVQISGTTWVITTNYIHTDQATIRLQVKAL